MLFEFHQLVKNVNKSLQTKLDIDKFVNCKWVDIRWQ